MTAKAASPAETAAAAAPAAAWRCNPTIQLHWRDWGSDSIAFEAVSGHTIQFEPLAAAAMACFEERPLSLAELAAELAGDLGGAADDDFTAALREIAEQFVRLGWLLPAPAGAAPR